jgi:hypothetical protein
MSLALKGLDEMQFTAEVALCQHRCIEEACMRFDVAGSSCLIRQLSQLISSMMQASAHLE